MRNEWFGGARSARPTTYEYDGSPGPKSTHFSLPNQGHALRAREVPRHGVLANSAGRRQTLPTTTSRARWRRRTARQMGMQSFVLPRWARAGQARRTGRADSGRSANEMMMMMMLLLAGDGTGERVTLPRAVPRPSPRYPVIV